MNIGGRFLYSRTIWELLFELVEGRLGAVYRRAMESGEIDKSRGYPTQFDRWIEATSYPIRDGVVIVVADVRTDHAA